MTVYLLGDIAKKGEATVFWDGGRERPQHLGRKILSFVNNDVTVATFAPVGLQFAIHSGGKVIPVIGLATALSLSQVTCVELKHYWTIDPRNPCRPAYPLHRDIVLFVHDAVLLNPLKLFFEKLLRALQHRALYTVGLRLAQCELDEPRSLIGSTYASPW